MRTEQRGMVLALPEMPLVGHAAARRLQVGRTGRLSQRAESASIRTGHRWGPCARTRLGFRAAAMSAATRPSAKEAHHAIHPVRPADRHSPVGGLFAPPAWAGPVDINTADASTLAKELNGVGPARAQAIVAYRNEHGPFKSVDDLALVKNMPRKVIESNRELLKGVDGASAGQAGRAARGKAGQTGQGRGSRQPLNPGKAGSHQPGASAGWSRPAPLCPAAGRCPKPLIQYRSGLGVACHAAFMRAALHLRPPVGITPPGGLDEFEVSDPHGSVPGGRPRHTLPARHQGRVRKKCCRWSTSR